ncbi:hypothetical protein AUQ37_05375 [Candidatus Methanomethylophilus sp. 1R26]|uniref:hypothetical protein n=1 Tax=Candidatus Methanomethylophilus sp. 1R26 TaxID=1769296 RepID=UPI0007372A1B|nr:hypothetical protein [Candidatus Methanomethylophilus sp. 1R26]KUE74222.1 hypothetical protein AUQ37_05375 [Candidatus Methanomethylophilus sp. 1R26]
MAKIPRTRDDFILLLDSTFRETSASDFRHSTLKAYYVESNLNPNIPPAMGSSFSEWRLLEGSWYICSDARGNWIIIDTYDKRVWVLYSLSIVDIADRAISKWISNNVGLDNCWFSKRNLESIGKINGLKERGIGLKYRNIASQAEDPFGFSLKAWYGNGANKDIEDLFDKLKRDFSTKSIRWSCIENGNTSMKLEWYNYGKVTVNYLEDAEDTLHLISSTLEKYHSALKDGEKARDEHKYAFEFTFTQKIDLEGYSAALSKGNSKLKLWMTEIDSQPDFKRFAGIDLHNLDRVILDMGEKYAYMNVPGKGCVNAAPRFAAVQGENACGNVDIMYEGREIFDLRQY